MPVSTSENNSDFPAIEKPTRRRLGIPPAPDPKQCYFTKREAAGYLRMSERSIRRLEERQLLRRCQLSSGKVIYSKTALDAVP
jgi:hypothetical protein